MSSLKTVWCSRAAAKQRAGRGTSSKGHLLATLPTELVGRRRSQSTGEPGKGGGGSCGNNTSRCKGGPHRPTDQSEQTTRHRISAPGIHGTRNATHGPGGFGHASVTARVARVTGRLFEQSAAAATHANGSASHREPDRHRSLEEIFGYCECEGPPLLLLLDSWCTSNDISNASAS